MQMGNNKTVEYRDEDSRLYTKHAMQIALLIDKAIEESDMNKSEFAKRIGKTTPEISKWLSGNQNFTLRTLSKIENALGLEIVKLFSREDLGLKGTPINRNISLSVVHDLYSVGVNNAVDFNSVSAGENELLEKLA